MASLTSVTRLADQHHFGQCLINGRSVLRAGFSPAITQSLTFNLGCPALPRSPVLSGEGVLGAPELAPNWSAGVWSARSRPPARAGSSPSTPPSPYAHGRPTQNISVRPRSEEHTSELQSRPHLVCRLL